MLSIAIALALAASPAAGDFADVNGSQMYYEVHGKGRPVVLLHGGLGTIETSFSKLVPELARDHRVIAIEQVGHGHSPDREGAYAYARQAEDTAALLSQIGISGADVVGYSDGAILALLIAARHPELVRKIVASGANVRPDGIEPKPLKWMREAPPEEFASKMAGAGRLEAYGRASPTGAGHWPVLAEKVRALWVGPVPLEPADLARITAPTLVVCGDRDTIRPEHTVEIFRALPRAQLLVLPDTGHDTFNTRATLLNPILAAFLDAPVPDAK